MLAKILITGDLQESILFCAHHFLEASRTAIKGKGRFQVALSGGSTPKALYALLTSPPFSQEIDWKNLHLFWGDERSVPPDHPESNYHMAMEAGFAKMPIPPSQIHRMEAEMDIQPAADRYNVLLQEKLRGNFDYIMLGMGPDGHTASLFPDTQGLKVTDRLAIANHVPQKNTWRMSLTFPCINAADRIVLYVMGAEKSPKLQEIFSSSQPLYPVQYIDKKALWIADKDAAKLLIYS